MSDSDEEFQFIRTFTDKEISSVLHIVDRLPDSHILDRVNNDNIDMLIDAGVVQLRGIRKRRLQPIRTDIAKLVDHIEGALCSHHALQCIVNDEEDFLAFQGVVELRRASNNPFNNDQQRVMTFVDEHLEDLNSSESIFAFEIKRRLSFYTDQLNVIGDIEDLRTNILPWWSNRIKYYRSKYSDRLDERDDSRPSFKMILDYCTQKVDMLQNASSEVYMGDQYYEVCTGLALIPFFITENFEEDTLLSAPTLFADS